MLGTRNIAVCGLGVPMDPIYATALTKPVAHLDRIVWEVSRDLGEGFIYTRRLECISELLQQFNNIEGILIDDLSTVGRKEGLTTADLKAFYDGKEPLTPQTMKAQCDTALAMLRDKRIFGVTFLLRGAENGPVVAWTRDWVREVSDEPLVI